jgi:hypothetical protein
MKEMISIGLTLPTGMRHMLSISVLAYLKMIISIRFDWGLYI